MEETDLRSHSPIFRASTPLDYKSPDPVSRSIFEIASFKYECKCKICNLESSYLFSSRPFQLKLLTQDKHKLKGFTWLLERLSDVSNETSVRINTPDVVLFRYGRPLAYIQTTREKLLKCSKSYERLKIQEVTKQIAIVSRTRKREELQNNKVMLSSASVDTGKEIACVRYMIKDTNNDQEEFSCYDEDGPLKVMNENEFTALAWERSSSNKWKALAYIQSVLKCKNSIGESFVHTYKFPENPKLPDVLDLFPEEEDLKIFQDNPVKYCECVFLRIYMYLNQFSNIQLKSIQGEFVKDENNRIWLVHASYIDHFERPLDSSPAKKSQIEITQSTISDIKSDLVFHLSLATKEQKNPRTEKIFQYMKEECDKIMNSTKFIEFFNHSSITRESATAYEKLRPSHTEHFPPFLNKNEVKRCSSEQKKIFITRGLDSESKNSSPGKKQKSWVHVPRLKFSPIQELKKRVRVSKSPILTQKSNHIKL